jgi:hypothetical protein
VQRCGGCGLRESTKRPLLLDRGLIATVFCFFCRGRQQRDLTPSSRCIRLRGQNTKMRPLDAMKMKKNLKKMKRTNACVEEQGKGMRRRETRLPRARRKGYAEVMCCSAQPAPTCLPALTCKGVRRRETQLPFGQGQDIKRSRVALKKKRS